MDVEHPLVTECPRYSAGTGVTCPHADHANAAPQDLRPAFQGSCKLREKARAARSDGVRRAYEQLADRFRSLAVQRQSEEKEADPRPDT